MAQERPLTPEKQLLKIIEDSKDNGGAAVKSQKAKHVGLSFLSPGAWLGRLFFVRDKLSSLPKGAEAFAFDIQLVNKLLGLSIFILLSYLISNSYFSMLKAKKIGNALLAGNRTGVKVTVPDINPVIKNQLDYYTEKISDRDIFAMISRRRVEEDANAGVTTEELNQVMETLKLVGISWSNNPDAIIEDTKANRTFFLKEGQEINKVKVKQIFKDKVIMVYGGKEIELK